MSADKNEEEKRALEAAEKAEQERLMINPNMDLIQYRFMLTCPYSTQEEKDSAKAKLLAAVKKQSMAPFYKYLCEEYQFAMDDSFMSSMQSSNKTELERLEEVIKDAVENLGETEIREAYLAKAEFLCVIGDKDAAVKAFEETLEKTVSLGQKLDIVMNTIRLGMFYGDKKLTEDSFEKAEVMMETGGDWDRRNRLKVYKAVYAASTKKFKEASELFLATVSTFTCNEMMTYLKFVEYTVLMAIYSLDRVDLKKKVVAGPEIQEMLHQSPIVKGFVDSLVACDYSAFYKSLVDIDELMMKDSILAPNRKHYVRELRILAYSQLLQSYRSVTLESMAQSFGVSIEFIDREIAHFVAAGRLNCKIDKVGGVIVTNRPDSKNAQYQASIKQGDLLLNRIQKLSQVIKI